MKVLKLGEVLAQNPLMLFADFRSLFLGRIISAIGDKFFTIALAWWVVSQGGENSGFHLGMLMAINVLGVVLFAPWMGAYADRLDKKRCMMAADAGRFILLALLTYFLYRGQLTLPLLYCFCFAIAAFMPLFESASKSSLVLLTDSSKAAESVAMDASVLQLSSVLGAAIGGIVLAGVGVLGAFLGNGLSFLLSLYFIWSIRTDLKPVAAFDKAHQRGQSREGLVYLRNNPGLGALLLVFSVNNFFAAPLMLFIPMVVKFLLQYSVSWVAVMEGALALGALTATLLLSCFPALHARGNIYQKLFLGSVVMGAMVLVLAGVRSGAMVSCALFLFGMAMGFGGISVQTAFQDFVPHEMKGRFFALAGAVSFAVLPLSFVLNGFILQYFTLPLVIAVNGVALMLAAIAFLLIPRVPEKTEIEAIKKASSTMFS